MILLSFFGAPMINLDVQLTDTIDHVRTKIEGIMAIPPDQQILKFGERELENGFTLSHYGIERYSTIHLEFSPESMELQFYTMDTSAITLHVKASYKIEDIREKLREITGNQPEDYMFHYTTVTERILLEDGKTLADYNIDEDSKLFYIWRP